MNGQFNQQNNAYILKDKKTKFPFQNYHFNRNYYMTVANDMSGESRVLEPYEKVFNRNSRYLFVKDGEAVWRLGTDEVDDFSCEYNLHSTCLKGVKEGLAVEAEAFVPNEEMGEYFIYRVKNTGTSLKRVSLAVGYPFELGETSVRCTCLQDGRLIASEVLPYHVYYDDYAKIRQKNNVSFSLSSRKADKVCCSEYALFDGANYNKDAVFACKKQMVSYAEKPVATFFYDLELSAGESVLFWTFTGLCKSYSDAEAFADRILENPNRAEEELEKAKERWEN